MDFFKKIKNKLTVFIPRKRKKTVFVFFLILALFFLLFLPTDYTSAQTVTGKLLQRVPFAEKILKGISIYAGVVAVLALILTFCHALVALAAAFLEGMLKPETYSYLMTPPFTDFIQSGWQLVRDVCNLFFLLALLFIAFCTILRIEKYHAKKTLLTLIIMAILINFSKPITIFIFDGSQLLMNYFLVNYKPGSTSNLTNATGLAHNLSRAFGGENFLDWFNALSYMLSIAVVWIYAIVLLCISAVLVIRIIAIYILIIISPLAFLLAIIPDFSRYSTKWWGALFRYSYIGPAMAFFLFLAFKLADIWGGMVAKNPGLGGGFHVFSALFDPQNEFIKLLPYFMIVIFLYASLMVSQQFGIALSGAVISRGKKIMNWGAKMALVRAPKWAVVTTGVPGAVKQKIESVPWAKRWLTKEGRKGALEEREAKLAEKMGVAGAREALRKKRVAETREKWKKEGKTVADFEQFLDSPNDVIREAAARELVRQNRVDKFSTYKKVLEAMKGRYATADEAINNKDSEIMSVVNAVKKKRPDFVAAFEYDSATLRKGRSMDQVYTDVLGTLKPAEWGDVALDKLIPNVQFRRFANSHFGTNMPAAARLEMAKNLSAKHAAYFKNPARRWI